MRFAVTSCMRNEALFLLEWIAHYRLYGFDEIIIATNDCTDGTDEICAQIAAQDPGFSHIENSVAPGQSPQINGMERVLDLPIMADITYLLHCDSDEFLNITEGSGSLADLVDACGESDCIALLWRPFGDSGIKRWQGGLVTETFARSASRPRPGIDMHKCLFKPSKFGRAIDHMPKDPISPNVSLTNARGEAMPTDALFRKTRARFRGASGELYTWDNASLDHYTIKSEDLFLLKNLRGDGMGLEHKKYYLNSTFWRRTNRNDVETSASNEYLTKIKEIIEDLRTIGDVRALEADAFQNFLTTRDAHLSPDTMEKYTLP